MAGCIPCFIIPLLLFIFHRYLQPILLKFWNPWGKTDETQKAVPDKMPTWSSCPCKDNDTCKRQEVDPEIQPNDKMKAA